MAWTPGAYRLGLILLLVYLLPLTALVLALHWDLRARRIDELHAQLAGVADIQAQHIQNTIRRAQSELRLLAEVVQTPEFRHVAHSAGQPSALDALLRESQFLRIEIRTAQGELRLAAGKPWPGTPPVNFASSAMGSGPSAAWRDADGQVIFALDMPLKRGAGTLRVGLPGQALTRATADVMGLGRSGETLIGARLPNGDALFLAPVRFDPDAALRRRVPASATAVPMIQALHGLDGNPAEVQDYAGRPVFAAARHIPGLNWAVVVKLSRTEALAPLNRQLLVTLVGLWLVSALVSYAVTRLVFLRVSRLHELAESFLSRYPQLRPHPGGSALDDELSRLSQALLAIFNYIEQSRGRLELAVRDSSAQLDQAQSELRTADEALMHSAKLSAIGEVALGVAHEINQPLTALQLKLDTWRRRPPSPEQQGPELDAAVKLIQQAGAITRHLRDLVNRRRAAPREVALDAILDRVETLFRQQFQRQKIQLNLPASVAAAPLRADAGEIEQALIHLLANARDAVAGRPDARIDIHVRSLDQMLQIEVADNGPGIPDALRPRIFETFFTTKSVGVGSGIGLPIARRLIELNKGALRLAEDNDLPGARFIIELPLPSPESQDDHRETHPDR